MKPFELINQTITEIRISSDFDKSAQLQCFESFWKISNGSIIKLPTFPTEELVKANSTEYLKKGFREGASLEKAMKLILEGQNIIDIHFSYFEGELDDDTLAFIELGNGFYVTQNSYAQAGVNYCANLQIYNKDQFMALSTAQTMMKSLNKELKTYANNG